jgi:putative ABC transport system permease protein
MKALHRKLFRDLWKLRGQLLAIIAVLACGIASYVSMLSVHASLRGSADDYFEKNRLPDVFARVSDAPGEVARRVADLPDVEAVETRVIEVVTLDVRGLAEPAVAQLVSLVTDRPSTFNAVHLRRGRLPRSGSTNEAVAHESFVNAHDIALGETVHVVIGGRREALRIVGVGLSPEYIFTMPPGNPWPDDKRFGVFWMDHEGLSTAVDMEGRWNDLTVSIARGASQQRVIDDIDRLLAPYGGRQAHGRDLQTSARFVDDELAQLENMGTTVPMLFLGVAAFLLNVVVSRLIAAQREQIAVLKAVGYSNLSVGLHFVQAVVVVVVVGTAIGTGFGAWMGDALLGVYHPYFRFPVLEFAIQPDRVVEAAATSTIAGLLATFFAVRRAVALPPAEAMRPPTPPTFERGILSKLGLGYLLGPAGRIVLRNIERRPWRTLLSGVGLSMGVGIMIAGTFSLDSMAYIMDVNFQRAQRDDLTIAFAEPMSPRALHDVASTPGVMYAEPMRVMPVRLRAGAHRYDTAIEGLPADARLRRLIDADAREVALPEGGLLLTDVLADRLGVAPGDHVQVEILEGRRRTREVLVSGTIAEMMGMSAYMRLPALDRLAADGPRITGARVLLEPEDRDVAYHHIKRLPGVAGATLRTAAYDIFNETTGQFQTATAMILGFFASIVTIGVVYNSARVVLAERARELASLRVLGFTCREVSVVLLGELFTQVVLAVPIGCLLGWLFAVGLVAGIDTELYRFPLIIAPKTYLTAVAVVVVAGVVTGFLVRRQIDHLDLVGVLKTRE